MITLYIVSSPGAGKTAISVGVARRLAADKKKVGFFKPVIDGAKPDTGDAAFMKQALALPEPLDTLSPSVGNGDITAKIKQAYASASQGKDVVIVEGTLGASPDDGLSQSAYQVAKALDAKVIAVQAYSDKSLNSYQGFGENLLGVVLNKVPKSQLKRVQSGVAAKSGVNVLAVLPEDRVLLSPTIAELADCIQGKILSNAEKSAELVENLLVGALTVDSGLLYFGRKDNKAAIVRADRPDMQLAALNTVTKCLVISGMVPPYYRVFEKAAARGIPLIQAEADINTIVKRIEEALTRARFAQEKKLPRLAEIMQQYFDFKALYKGLGLAK